MQSETESPTKEQQQILERVKDRVLQELYLEKSDEYLDRKQSSVQQKEEPLRGFIHGPPGTGKSRLIQFIRRFFIEALEWEHGVTFMFVAFQNRVAYAMGGTTLHAGGDVAVGGPGSRKLGHLDIDVLFTRNQHLRWVLIDEVGMIGDELLGSFESNLTDQSLFTRSDMTRQNVLLVGTVP